MSWYAVFTKPRQERVARENLERQNFEAYLPLLRSKRKRRGTWLEYIEPMFSRYLFIRFEPGITNIASVRSTRGVSGMVQFGSALVPVPDVFMAALLQTADADSDIHSPEPRHLRSGDDVVLTDGPLANLRGIFKATDGETRAIILLSLLGAETQVTVPVEQIWRQA